MLSPGNIVVSPETKHRYTLIDDIGSGTYARCWSAHDGADNTDVCLKEVFFSQLAAKQKSAALAEAKLHRSFRHPNIVRFHEAFLHKNGASDGSDESLIIAMDLAHTSLDIVISARAEKAAHFTLDEVYNVFSSIVRGVEYLHKNKIIHRDLSCKNILLDLQKSTDLLSPVTHVMLADFGTCRLLESTNINAQTQVGTLVTMAPEIFDESGYDFKVDIWSLGCILYELIRLAPLFSGRNMISIMHKIQGFTTLSAENEILSVYKVENSLRLRNLLDTLQTILQKIPEHRPTCSEILAILDDDGMSSAHSIDSLPPDRKDVVSPSHIVSEPVSPHKQYHDSDDTIPVAMPAHSHSLAAITESNYSGSQAQSPMTGLPMDALLGPPERIHNRAAHHRVSDPLNDHDPEASPMMLGRPFAHVARKRLARKKKLISRFIWIDFVDGVFTVSTEYPQQRKDEDPSSPDKVPSSMPSIELPVQDTPSAVSSPAEKIYDLYVRDAFKANVFNDELVENSPVRGSAPSFSTDPDDGAQALRVDSRNSTGRRVRRSYASGMNLEGTVSLNSPGVNENFMPASDSPFSSQTKNVGGGSRRISHLGRNYAHKKGSVSVDQTASVKKASSTSVQQATSVAKAGGQNADARAAASRNEISRFKLQRKKERSSDKFDVLIYTGLPEETVKALEAESDAKSAQK